MALQQQLSSSVSNTHHNPISTSCATRPSTTSSRSRRHSASLAAVRGASQPSSVAAAARGAAPPPPPDVVPDVLLYLQSELLQQQQHHSQDQGQQQQQNEQHQELLVPRTSRRLEGLQGQQLPAFIPSLAPQPDPQLVVWQQQTLEAWHAASSWAQQHQQQQQQQLPGHSQPTQDNADALITMQQLLGGVGGQQQPQHQQQQGREQGPAHWAPLAAVMQAAGQHLQLQHLLQLTSALHHLLLTAAAVANSQDVSTTAAADSSSSSSSSLAEAGAASLFVPNVMTVTLPQQHTTRGGGGGSSGRQLVLESTTLLPQLSSLLLSKLQQTPGPQQQPQQQDGGDETAALVQQQEDASVVDAAASGSVNSTTTAAGTPLGSSAAVCLLQQLADCCSSISSSSSGGGGGGGVAQLGSVDPQLVTLLVEQHVQLQECSLEELATLLQSCARLGHPHKASWLQAFVNTALEALQPAAASAAASASDSIAVPSPPDSLEAPAASAATEADVAAGASEGAAAAAGGSIESDKVQAFTVTVAQLLEAVARYPGPHADTPQLRPFLEALQPHLTHITPATLQTLGTAVAALKLKPGAAWRHAVAAAARKKFGRCSMSQLVQLLLGVTAGGYNPQEHWWRGWFAATMRKCESLFGAHTGPDWAPKVVPAGGVDAAGAEAVASPTSSNSSSSNDNSDGDEGDTTTSSSSRNQQHLQQQQEQHHPAHDKLPASVLSTVCLVLLQLGRQVHPLWMAGMLEAYLHTSCRSSTSTSTIPSTPPAEDLAATPQLLLLCSRLLEAPPAFAVRYKPLLLRLLEPLQLNFNLLNPEQMAQAAEVCAVYHINISLEWYRWHGAAILRLGKTFPLDALARVRDAYRAQEVPAEQQLAQLLDTVPWRLARQQEVQAREQRLADKKAMIGFKMDQRRRQNEADAAKKAAAKSAAAAAARSRGAGAGGDDGSRSSSSSGGSASDSNLGMGYKGPGGKANWRKRKLKPPGTLDRKF